MKHTSTINLDKGAARDVARGVERVLVGCGWDAQERPGDQAFDVDVSCALLDAQGCLPADAFYVYYGALRFGADVVVHTGDNLTGAGAGDDERLLIDLARVPREVAQIDVLISIYRGAERGQTFGMISDCYTRVVDVTHERDTAKTGPLYDATTYAGAEFARCAVNDAALTADGMLFGAFVRVGDGWRFRCVQKVLHGGIKAYLESVAPRGLALAGRASLELSPGVAGAVAFAADNRAALGVSLCALALTQFVGLAPLCVAAAIFAFVSFFANGRRLRV